MSQQQISIRYAKGLYLLAKEQKSVDEIHFSLMDIRNIILAVSEFRDFIKNPLLNQAERAKILTSVFSTKVPALVEKFLLYINCKNRLSLLEEMIIAFDDLYLIERQTVRARVQAAQELDAKIKEELLTSLGHTYGKKVVAQWDVREDILGGFRILINGRVHDYSFTNQLLKFRDAVLR